MAAASAITKAVPFADVVSHLQPGCFALLVNARYREMAAALATAALDMIDLPIELAVRPVPTSAALAGSFPGSLLKP
jgi:hypothetical protein